MALYRSVTAVLAVLLAGACSSTADPLRPTTALQPGETLLTTDAPAYEVREETPIRAAVDFELTYRNPLGVAVAVPACHSPARPALEKLVGGKWVHAFSSVELLCITPPLVIPAGGTHHFRYQMRADAHDLARWLGATDGSLPGRYRLRWWVGVRDRRADTGVGTALADKYVVSNSFDLRVR